MEIMIGLGVSLIIIGYMILVVMLTIWIFKRMKIREEECTLKIMGKVKRWRGSMAVEVEYEYKDKIYSQEVPTFASRLKIKKGDLIEIKINPFSPRRVYIENPR